MIPMIFDDVLPDPLAYRAACLAMPRQSHTLAEGVTFHGIGWIPDRSVPDWIEAKIPELRVVTSLTRLSPAGQTCPNYIHTDCDMGQVTGIFYLNPDPPASDGTTFWRHRETGKELSTAVTRTDQIAEGRGWRDLAQWDAVQTIAARFNRLILFPAAAFHSRAIFENYGADDQDARLIQMCFCEGTL